MDTYLAMWDMYGLECLFNVTEWHKKTTWSLLTDKDQPNAPNINMMMLRARMNSQRCYEIYTFNATAGLTEEMLRQAFTDNPQGIVDLIRNQGNKIYSDRSETHKQVIV
jgi:hypothetical protein